MTSWRPSRRLEGAEDRLERRERIVGHLRLRVRDPGEEGRLAGVRQADERRVGEQLQPQLDVVLLTRRTYLCEPRHLPGRRDEASVASPTLAALGENHAGAGVREVGEEVAVHEDLRPDGHAQLGVGAVRAVLPGSASVLAAPRLDAVPPLQHREVAERRVRNQDDIAAVAAVAAVGAAFRHVLLAAEAEPAVAALARLNVDRRAVAEHDAVAGAA